MNTNLLLYSHSFIVAVFSWFIPALLRVLPAFLLRNLVTLLNRFLPALLGRLSPAFLFRDIDTHLVGDRDATLLWNLLASLVGHLLALRVSHGGADFMRSRPALGVGDLLAVLHRQLLALLGGCAPLHWNIVADSFVLDLVVHRLLDHLLGLDFPLSSLLLSKKKPNAETKFLANVRSSHGASKISGSKSTKAESKMAQGTFLSHGTIGDGNDFTSFSIRGFLGPLLF